jgi:hypothetical protein
MKHGPRHASRPMLVELFAVVPAARIALAVDANMDLVDQSSANTKIAASPFTGSRIPAVGS